MKRKIIILASIIILLILVGSITYILLTKDKARLTINTSPIKTTITIDGVDKSLQNSGSKHTIPINKSVKIVITREGFASRSIDYRYDSSSSDVAEINIPLDPTSKEAEELLSNSNESAHREAIVNYWYSNLAEEMEQENPILQKLPHYDTYFTMSQGISMKNPDDQQSFALYVDIFDVFEDEGRNESIRFLEDNGYDPSDFEIIYRVSKYKTRDEE